MYTVIKFITVIYYILCDIYYISQYYILYIHQYTLYIRQIFYNVKVFQINDNMEKLHKMKNIKAYLHTLFHNK